MAASIQYRKTIPVTRRTAVHVGKTGVGVTTRVGHVSVSSRGRVSVRLAPGLSLRFGGRR